MGDFKKCFSFLCNKYEFLYNSRDTAYSLVFINHVLCLYQALLSANR